jgi:hypothetical protein
MADTDLMSDKALAGLTDLQRAAAEAAGQGDGDDVEIEIAADEPAEEFNIPDAPEDKPVEEPKEGGLGERKESDEDDEGSYSERVQKRIQREREATKREREARQKAEAELAKIRAERETADLDDAIKKKQGELKEAHLDVDYDKIAAIQSEITELNVRKALKLSGAAQPKQDDAGSDSDGGGEPDDKPHPKAQAWINRNQRWFKDGRFAAQTNAAYAINKALLDEGKDPTSDAFYAELDRRLHDSVRLPQDVMPRKATSPVDAGESRDPGPSRSPKRVVLTTADITQMRTFGLDPENKEHLKEFARQKAATRASERSAR